MRKKQEGSALQCQVLDKVAGRHEAVSETPSKEAGEGTGEETSLYAEISRVGCAY